MSEFGSSSLFRSTPSGNSDSVFQDVLVSPMENFRNAPLTINTIDFTPSNYKQTDKRSRLTGTDPENLDDSGM